MPGMEVVNDVLDNISIFDTVTNKNEFNQKMPRLLASLGKYSLSERAYIFTWSSEKERILHMTYEWCAEGISPTIDIMQEVKMEDMPNWAPKLERDEAIVSMDWDAEKKVHRKSMKFLTVRGYVR